MADAADYPRHFHDLLMSASVQRFIELFIAQHRRVRELELELLDWPTVALHSAVSRFTEKCQRTLHTFRLEIQTGRLAGFPEFKKPQVSRLNVL